VKSNAGEFHEVILYKQHGEWDAKISKGRNEETRKAKHKAENSTGGGGVVDKARTEPLRLTNGYDERECE
jgi:hypothetical protein